MDLYAALDVSLDETAICVVDRDGAIVLEAKVASEAAAIAARAATLCRVLVPDRSGSWTALGMARPRPCRTPTRCRADGNPPRAGGPLGEDCQDRPQRRPRQANLLRMPGARQDDGCPRAARAARHPVHPQPSAARHRETAFVVCCAASACGHPACCGAAGTLPSVISSPGIRAYPILSSRC